MRNFYRLKIFSFKMWSFFSRDSTKVFPFEIGDKISSSEDDDYSIWKLHDGKQKSNGQSVSIFVFNVAENTEVCKQIAQSAIKTLRTLRHPNVLTFLDSLESDKFIYLVTEHVKPLSEHLKNLEKNQNLEISWGLHQVAKGLGFLVNSVNLIHNNVNMASMFVNQAGEWKIGGIDYMYPASGEGSNVPPLKPLPCLEKYEVPEKSSNRSRKSQKWSIDMWGLGCLIWEVYNSRLPRSSSLKIINKIPKNLLKNYCELVSANPVSRPSPERFVENCRTASGFMANHFVSTNLFLDEIQIKDQEEQSKFFDDLTSHLDEFPVAYSKYKILPQLLNVYQYGNAGPAVLPPLFKLGKYMDETEYQAQIVPCVIKLFSSTDRATRIYLLRQLPIFAEHLKPQVVNSQVFPNMVTGFMDTNPAIREQTVKGMLLLAPKLNDVNLNTELMKHFARLQSRDDQGPIRTNTTVCLGKIAQYLNPVTRQRVVTSAFARAMKDPFPAARTAGVLAMVNTIKYFSLKDCAFKAIPTLSSLTIDPDKQVRDQVFKSLKVFIDRLQDASDHPEKAVKIDEEATVTGPATPSAKWAGWMTTGVTSLTSKLYSSSKTPSADGKNNQANQQKPVTSNTPAKKEQNEEKKEEDPPKTTPKSEEWDGESWDDIQKPELKTDLKVGKLKVISKLRKQEDQMWQSLDLDGDQTLEEKSEKDKIVRSKNQINQISESPEESGWNDDTWGDDVKDPEESGWDDNTWDDDVKDPEESGWDDEGFEPFETTESSSNDVPPASTYDWKSNDVEDNFFSEFTSKPTPKQVSLSSKQKKKSVVHQKVVKKEDSDWGWGESNWDEDTNSSSSAAEKLKLEREEKRKQRKKAIEDRRLNRTKLGTRKCD